MRRLAMCVASGLALAALGGLAQACEIGGAAAFEDEFDTLDPTWGDLDNYRAEDGSLVISPPKGFNTSTINSAGLYDDIEVCVEMTVAAEAPDSTCGSIIFWAIDYDNYYSFQVTTEGEASFWRRQRGKWLTQVPWQKAEGFDSERGEINELLVKIKGDRASLYINGTLFKDVKGRPPADGSQVGLLACAPTGESTSVAFDNFVVMEDK